MAKPQSAAFQDLLTDRHFNECKRCMENCEQLGALLDKAESTGMDVGPGRELRNRQLERLTGYLAQFFPDRS